MTAPSGFFETFRKPSHSEFPVKKKKENRNFFFILLFDDRGAYVKTVNSSLKDKKVVSDNYSGSLRAVVELYNEKKIKSRLIVDWQNPYSRLYLTDHQDLADLLIGAENLVDRDGRRIYFRDTRQPVVLQGNLSEGVLNFKATLCENEIDRVLNESYILSGNKIFSTNSLGKNFRSLPDLNTSIMPDEITTFLSIVYSHFTSVEVRYNSLSIKRKGSFELQPALIIESVDDSGFVTLTTSYCYSKLLTPEFYRDYSPTSLAWFSGEGEITISSLIIPEHDSGDRLVQLLMYIEQDYGVKEGFHIDTEGVVLSHELAAILFSRELKSVIDNFDLFGEKFLKKNRLKKATPNLELLLTTSIDYLQGNAFLTFSGEELPLYQAISHYQSKGYIPLKDGSKGVPDPSFIRKIQKVIRQGKEGIEVSFFDLPYICQELEGKISGEEFKERIHSYLYNKPSDISVENTFIEGELREYQKEGLQWMLNLHKVGISGCLADDMGLGKTVQALSFFMQVKGESEKPSLLVLPKSLIFNWIKEIEKFTPDLDYHVYYGNRRDKHQIGSHSLTLTTYHTLRNDSEALQDYEFHYIILDEIQHIKNHKSLISKAICLLKSDYRLGISGTPVENSLSDLYGISRFLNPTLFGSYRSFKEQWSGPAWDERVEILKRKIQPLFLRRLKEEVLTELPDKTEQVLYIDMSEKQKQYYEKVRKEYHDVIRLKIEKEGMDKSRFIIIKAFMELRQIATIPGHRTRGLLTSSKEEVLIEHIRETLANGHKALIFSNFLYAVKSFSSLLEKESIGHRVITGATDKRDKAVEDFMDDPEVKVMIMTLKTGGVGLNLTAASYVYILDPWWNPASENQAIDRTHRIGQKNPVFCYRLIARDSIEERILDLHSRKSELFEKLFSPEERDGVALSREDIDYLLG